MLVNQPAILSGAFAAEGDKNTIPANNDGLSGLASIAKGFPPITQVPLAQGGQPPQRQDFNGIFNLFSQFLLYAQNGGVYTYNNTLDYQPPCIISYDGEFYSCLQENGPFTSAGVQAPTIATYWEKLVPDVAVMTGASASQAGTAGLVPAPPQNSQNKALLGNGTFGNVVQSVNGQTGTVTLDFIESLNTQNLSSTQKDFNDYTEAGAYYFTYQTYSNSPSGSTAINGFLLVEGQGDSSAYYLQTFYQAGEAGNQNVNIYFRKCIGGTWTLWVQVRFIIESSVSGTTWYRVYNDGWVEQGGIIYSVSNETRTITLPKAMANTNYYCACTVKGVASAGTYASPMMTMQAVNTTQASITFRSSNDNQNIFWQVIGQGA